MRDMILNSLLAYSAFYYSFKNSFLYFWLAWGREVVRAVIFIVVWSDFCISIYVFACIIYFYMHTTMARTLSLPSEQLTHSKISLSSCRLPVLLITKVSPSAEKTDPTVMLQILRQWCIIPLGIWNVSTPAMRGCQSYLQCGIEIMLCQC